MSLLEADNAGAFIFNLLSTDSMIAGIVGTHPTKGMIQVYERVAPEGATYPLVIYSMITSHYKRGSGGYRVYARMFYEVKGVNTGESYGGDLSTLAQRIDALMSMAQDIEDEPIIAGISGLRVVQREDYENNERHNHYGGEYEVWAYGGSNG